MRSDQGDCDFSAGQTHREVFHGAALGKKFGLSGKLEPRFVHPRFVNWSGHDPVQLAAPRAGTSFLNAAAGGAPVLTVGGPCLEPGFRPVTTFLTEFGT